jgi:hypothetical protein
MTGVMTGGSRLSARGGVSWVPVRELARWAAGWLLLLGWFGSPGSKTFLFCFPPFLISVFPFLYSDLSFERFYKSDLKENQS